VEASPPGDTVYLAIVFVHVATAFTFAFAHGATAFAMWRISRETDAARVRALLELSDASLLPSAIAFALMGVTGISAAFMGNFWNELWVWASIAALTILWVFGYLARNYFRRIRLAVGAPRRSLFGRTASPIDRSSKTEEEERPDLCAAVTSGHPELTMTLGMAGILVTLLLMVFKP